MASIGPAPTRDAPAPAPAGADRLGDVSIEMKLKSLVGSGDRIGLFFLPFAILGVFADLAFPSILAIRQTIEVTVVGIVLLAPGLVVWAWSAALILSQVPNGRLITSGPYALVKHPLYTGVALLALPGLGFLLGTWLGLLLGLVLYLASRIFAPREELTLSKTFGPAWEDYTRRVRIGWL
jgi:protein-S-isoprenylcysteine O-methyltransferase Ste14